MSGFQGAGVVNVARGDVSGCQIASVVNTAGGSLDGAQISVVNVAGKSRGAQLGVVNVAGDFKGLQAGVVNVAKEVRGAQLGVLNVAGEMKGVPIGLVNVSKNGGLGPVAWWSSLTAANAGVRFRSGRFYSIIAAGGANREADDGIGKSVAAQFFYGFRIPLERWFVDCDAGFSHLDNEPLYSESASNDQWRSRVAERGHLVCRRILRVRGRRDRYLWDYGKSTRADTSRSSSPAPLSSLNRVENIFHCRVTLFLPFGVSLICDRPAAAASREHRRKP